MKTEFIEHGANVFKDIFVLLARQVRGLAAAHGLDGGVVHGYEVYLKSLLDWPSKVAANAGEEAHEASLSFRNPLLVSLIFQFLTDEYLH